MDDAYEPLSSSNTEPQLLLESGAMQIKDFNPKAILRFTGRKCVTCGNEILDHWLLPYLTQEAAGIYYCDKYGRRMSEGITDCKWDVPKDFGSTIK